MGLFDSIRRVVGGESTTDDGGEDLSGLVDTNTLDEPSLRRHAEDVAGEVGQLDFSLASLEQFDSAIDAGYDEELTTADDPATYGTDAVRFGCYLGEVLVRRYDGEWTNDPQWGVTITGPNDSATVSVFEVAQRSIKTKAVFAAVTERAAEEIGLEGEGGAAETEPDGTDTDPDDPPATGEQPAISEVAESEHGFEFERAADEESGPAESDGAVAAPDDVATGSDEPVTGEPAASDDTADPLTDVTESGNSDGSEAKPSAESATDSSVEVDDAAALVEEAEPEATREPNDSESLFDEADDPTQGDGLRAEYAAEAAAFVSFWNERDLDYTPESLTRLDDLVAAEWDDDRFDDAEFGSEATFDDRAFTSVSRELGSYFGEVLARQLDGKWTDETTNDSVVVTGPDGPLAIPVFRVAGTSLKERPVFERSYDSLLADIDT